MTDEPRLDSADPTPRNRVDIFLDDAVQPLLSTTPPLNFELDTSRMEDGPHVMRIEAYDGNGVRGVRTVDFTVRNGPGIAISGLRQHDVLDGKIPIIVNAYGGTSAVDWEPSQAETPAPPPTWAWVSLIIFIAFNVAGIGLSEIQRRFLAEHSRDLLLELRKVEQQKLVDEAEALNRQNRLLGEIAARLNNVEISIEKKAGQPR